MAVVLVFRQRGRFRVKGPFGTELDVDASNEPTPAPSAPGVKVEDAKAKKGGLMAEDRTGRGAEVRNVEVQDDILVSSTPPEQGGEPKKAEPPE